MPPSISIGQSQGLDSELVAYCDDCKRPVNAYWVKKDGVAVAAVCPEVGHNTPCRINQPLRWD